MLDEWPRLEKKVRSADVVFRKANGVENLRLVTSGEGLREGHLVLHYRA